MIRSIAAAVVVAITVTTGFHTSAQAPSTSVQMAGLTQPVEILRHAGYDAQAIARVQSLVKKERIKHDPEAQTLEDVTCLVFLEHEFAPFAA